MDPLALIGLVLLGLTAAAGFLWWLASVSFNVGQIKGMLQTEIAGIKDEQADQCDRISGVEARVHGHEGRIIRLETGRRDAAPCST